MGASQAEVTFVLTEPPPVEVQVQPLPPKGMTAEEELMALKEVAPTDQSP